MDYENCGSDVENTFTVPEGFSYRWTCNDDTTTLSTSRSLHVTQPGDYHCNLRFLGSDNSTSCSFEMTATASQRHPAAIIAAERLNDDCNPLYLFRNLSVISLDSAHQQLTSTPCDAIQWIVDGSPQTLSGDSLSFVATTGLHSVQLVASLSGGCTDTAFYLIDIPLNDTVIAHEIVENQIPYLFAGSYFSNNVSDTTILLTDSHGCDSVIHFSLTVWPNIHSSYDTTVCPVALPLLWHGVTFDSTDFTGISTPHSLSSAAPNRTVPTAFCLSPSPGWTTAR